MSPLSMVKRSTPDTSMVYELWVLELLASAKRYRDEWHRHSSDAFRTGTVYAYYDVLSKLYHIAARLGVDPESLGLPDELEREIL